MINLKDETISILAANGKTVNDILWVGCPSYEIDVDEFWKLADQVYDNGYGTTEVAIDLVVVGSDWWLERHDYDGSEWWEFKHIPDKPAKKLTVKRVMGHDYWETLSDKNVESPADKLFF